MKGFKNLFPTSFNDMASPAESGPVRTMKRTGRSPWATPGGMAGGSGSVSNSPNTTGGESPQEGEIVKVMSDIPAPTMGSLNEPTPAVRSLYPPTGQPVVPPKANGLAHSRQIMALQKEWEKKQSAAGGRASLPANVGGGSGSGSSEAPGKKAVAASPDARSTPKSTTPVPFPNAGQPRKRSRADMGTPVPIPDPKRRHSEISEAPPVHPQGQGQGQKALMLETDVRAQARRFTEESVLKHLSEANKTYRPGSSHKPTPAPVATQPSSSSALRQFDTPAQLLARIKAAGQTDDAFSPVSDSTVSDEDVIQMTSLELAKRATAIPTPIKMATDGRPYTLFRRHDGGLEVSRGVLFPAGYELYPDPLLPYVCPVRDCRRIFETLYKLAHHFAPRHNGKTFNDNLDGTLSQTSIYAKSHGSKQELPMVTSQKPLPPNAEPPVAAGTPQDLLKAKSGAAKLGRPKKPVKPSLPVRTGTVARAQSAQTTPQTTPVPLPPLPSNVQMPTPEVLRYLHSFVASNHGAPGREDVKAMALLPRRRNLPIDWIESHRGTTLGTNMYACAMAYIVGDEVKGKGVCDSQLFSTSRLSQPCVALPAILSATARAAFFKETTCVGCHYWSMLQRRENICSWAARKSGTPRQDSDQELMDLDVADSDVQIVERAITLRRSQGAAASETGASVDSPEPQSVPQTLANRRERRQRRGRTTVASSPESADEGQKKHIGNESEMETWEVAPGRLTNKAGDNIVFSSAYLTNTQPVTVAPDIGMNNLVIKPGNSTHWAAAEDTIRACTVLEGKLRLKLEGETMQLGPRGGFIIRPGMSGSAENRQYKEAVIACTTVKSYELLSDGEN